MNIDNIKRLNEGESRVFTSGEVLPKDNVIGLEREIKSLTEKIQGTLPVSIGRF